MGFPLASASLNVSQILCDHLQLLRTASASMVSKVVVPCSSVTLRSFAEASHSLEHSVLRQHSAAFKIVTAGGQEGKANHTKQEQRHGAPLLDRDGYIPLLDRMHAQLLLRLYDQWQTLRYSRRRNSRMPMHMEFPRLLRALSVHMQRTLRDQPLVWDVQQVLTALHGHQARPSPAQASRRLLSSCGLLSWCEREGSRRLRSKEDQSSTRPQLDADLGASSQQGKPQEVGRYEHLLSRASEAYSVLVE